MVSPHFRHAAACRYLWITALHPTPGWRAWKRATTPGRMPRHVMSASHRDADEHQAVYPLVGARCHVPVDGCWVAGCWGGALRPPARWRASRRGDTCVARSSAGNRAESVCDVHERRHRRSLSSSTFTGTQHRSSSQYCPIRSLPNEWCGSSLVSVNPTAW